MNVWTSERATNQTNKQTYKRMNKRNKTERIIYYIDNRDIDIPLSKINTSIRATRKECTSLCVCGWRMGRKKNVKPSVTSQSKNNCMEWVSFCCYYYSYKFLVSNVAKTIKFYLFWVSIVHDMSSVVQCT